MMQTSLPTSVIDPNLEYKATYLSDKLIQLDNGMIFSIKVPGLKGDIITVKIPRGRLAFPVAVIVKDYYNNPDKDKRNSLGQKVTYFGNAIAGAARSIQTMHDNMYREPAVASGKDTFGIGLTDCKPIEIQDGMRLAFTFQDRGATTVPVITTYSEAIYKNGTRLVETTDYTINYTTGTISFIVAPILTDVIRMDCHKPMDQPSDWEKNISLIY